MSSAFPPTDSFQRKMATSLQNQYFLKTFCLKAIAYIIHSAISRRSEVVIPLYSALVRLCPEYCVQFLGPSLQERHWSPGVYPEKSNEAVRGLEHRPYGEQLKEPGLFSLEKRRLRRDLIPLYNILEGGCDDVRVGLFSQVTVIGREVMASSCTRGGSGWILGNIYSQE